MNLYELLSRAAGLGVPLTAFETATLSRDGRGTYHGVRGQACRYHEKSSRSPFKKRAQASVKVELAEALEELCHVCLGDYDLDQADWNLTRALRCTLRLQDVTITAQEALTRGAGPVELARTFGALAEDYAAAVHVQVLGSTLGTAGKERLVAAALESAQGPGQLLLQAVYDAVRSPAQRRRIEELVEDESGGPEETTSERELLVLVERGEADQERGLYGAVSVAYRESSSIYALVLRCPSTVARWTLAHAERNHFAAVLCDPDETSALETALTLYDPVDGEAFSTLAAAVEAGRCV